MKTKKKALTLTKETVKDLAVRTSLKAGANFRSNDVLSPCGPVGRPLPQ